MNGTKSDTRCCISSNRFTEDVFLRQSRKLLLYKLLIILIRCYINIFKLYEWADTLNCQPSSVRDKNCFGSVTRLLGQKRSPLPPAIMSAVFFILISIPQAF